MELASLRGGCWRGGVAAGGEGFPPQRDLRGFGGSGGKVASVSPAQLGARKPAGLPPRPGPPPSGDPSSLVGSRGTGGREGVGSEKASSLQLFPHSSTPKWKELWV